MGYVEFRINFNLAVDNIEPWEVGEFFADLSLDLPDRIEVSGGVSTCGWGIEDEDEAEGIKETLIKAGLLLN